MAREHAATPRRNTGGEDDKGKRHEAAQNTQKKQTTGAKSTAKTLILAGNSTPAHTHTDKKKSQCRQSAGERIRPSTQQTHTTPADTHQWTRTRRRDTPPPPLVQSHSLQDAATATQPTHNAHRTSAHTTSHTRKWLLIQP
ncbi:exo-alpha-sialidase, partial [Trypanosoma cruzi]